MNHHLIVALKATHYSGIQHVYSLLQELVLVIKDHFSVHDRGINHMTVIFMIKVKHNYVGHVFFDWQVVTM